MSLTTYLIFIFENVVFIVILSLLYIALKKYEKLSNNIHTASELNKNAMNDQLALHYLSHRLENVDGINAIIANNIYDPGKISNGDITFDALHMRTYVMFIKLCLYAWRDPHDAYVWRAIRSNNPNTTTFFLGIGKDKATQIRMAIPLSLWHETSFAVRLDHPPDFESHSEEEFLNRIRLYLVQ
jgi:hypothetical protein